MTPRLSGHFSIFGLVFFVLKSLLGIGHSHDGVVLLLGPESCRFFLSGNSRGVSITKALIFICP